MSACHSFNSCLLVVSWLTWKKPRTRKVNGLELTIKFCAVKTKLAASTSRKFKICKISSRFLYNIFFRAFAARLGHSACSLIFVDVFKVLVFCWVVCTFVNVFQCDTASLKCVVNVLKRGANDSK